MSFSNAPLLEKLLITLTGTAYIQLYSDDMVSDGAICLASSFEFTSHISLYEIESVNTNEQV